MNKNDVDDFLKLLQEIEGQDYDEDDSAVELARLEAESLRGEAWTRKERAEMIKKNLDVFANLTDAKMPQIKEKLKVHNNIKVGKFTIKITNRRDDMDGYGFFYLELYENIETRNSFGYRKMDQKVNISKDNRFSDRPWISYFKPFVSAKVVIPEETVAAIIRWLQVLTRTSAFI